MPFPSSKRSPKRSHLESKPDMSESKEVFRGKMQVPADPALRAFVDAWSARPPAEIAAFAARLSPEKDPGPRHKEPSPDIERIRTIAAVSGAVRPASLVPDQADPGQAAGLLGTIAEDFDRSVLGGHMTWTLRLQPRSAILRRLRDDPTELAHVLQLAGRIKTDPAGQVLRRLLGQMAAPGDGAPAIPDARADASDADVAQALIWAADFGDFDADLARATGRVHTRTILESYAGLLKHGLVGRDLAQSLVEAFMEAPPDTNDPTIPILVLTGIGGVGKSTLLAEILRPRLTALLAGEAVPAVVVMDLDRVAFRPHAEAELSYEVSRQLEPFWPELAKPMAEARAQETEFRFERREFAAGASPDSETSSRSAYSFLWRMRELLAGSARSREPVTLILDTFEEWQRTRPFPGPRESWNNPEYAMVEWLRGLRDSMGLVGLRVVVSGRARLDAAPNEEIQLGDLDDDAASELLMRLGVRPGVAPRLQALVGGNPLSLHVAARFVGRLSAEEREAFLGGDKLDPALDEELRRAVLYDRFLNHIGNKDARRLAHPGLLIRRVTPRIVKEVLAEPCGFKSMSDQEAEHLVDRLADEVWLVRRAEDGSLRHQPEVRRAMLAMMSRDPKMQERAREIHQRAADWYNPHPDLMEQPRTEAIEAFYHRMMLSSGEPPIVGPPTLPGHRSAEDLHHARFARELGESVTEMAPAVEAQLRLLRDEGLPPGLADLLPDFLWERHVEMTGASLVRMDESAAAVDLFLKRQRPGWTAQPTWLAQAFCDTARWDDYAAGVRKRDTFPAGRYDFVNLIVTENEAARARQHLSGVEAPPADDGGFLRAFMVALVNAQAGRNVREVPVPTTTQRKDAQTLAFPVDQLRQVIVHLLTGAPLPWRGGRAAVFPDLAGLLVPDPEVMKAFGLLTANAGFTKVVRELEDLAYRAAAKRPDGKPGLQSHDVLGSLAAQVAKSRIGALAELDDVTVQGAKPALRGDNPELRPAIRHVLQSVAPGDGWLKTLGEVATALLPVPVLDLRPDSLPLLSEVASRTALVTLVEYVDRSRVMRQFLGSVREQHPQPPRLDPLVRAFNRWDDAHNRLLAAVEGRRNP